MTRLLTNEELLKAYENQAKQFMAVVLALIDKGILTVDEIGAAKLKVCAEWDQQRAKYEETGILPGTDTVIENNQMYCNRCGRVLLGTTQVAELRVGEVVKCPDCDCKYTGH